MTPAGGFAKMALSSGFVATAVAAGALDTSWGSWLLAGLVASWLGDLALVGRSRGAFITGLGAFMSAHLCYVAGFFDRGLDGGVALTAAAATAAIGAALLVWLRPHTGVLFPAVTLYVVAIAAMVAAAAGTHAYAAAWAFVAGAIGFAVSDIAVARHRFVTASPVNTRWGLPLYYASQFLIAVASGG